MVRDTLVHTYKNPVCRLLAPVCARLRGEYAGEAPNTPLHIPAHFPLPALLNCHQHPGEYTGRNPGGYPRLLSAMWHPLSHVEP